MLELVEVILWLLDVTIQVIFAYGTERIPDNYGKPLFRYSIWAYFGLAVLGACVGLVISQLVPTRILPSSGARGASLILSPLFAGMTMKIFGRWRETKGLQPTVAETFWGGAAFAFGAALVRWLMVGQNYLGERIGN